VTTLYPALPNNSGCGPTQVSALLPPRYIAVPAVQEYPRVNKEVSAWNLTIVPNYTNRTTGQGKLVLENPAHTPERHTSPSRAHPFRSSPDTLSIFTTEYWSQSQSGITGEHESC
jgi:hypothetical protein